MGKPIEIEVDLDDKLLARAFEYTDISDHSELMKRSLELLIERAEREEFDFSMG